ncbi:MAG: peptidylprolyl isomerase [Pyrinomonadaceae bacterium]
MPFRLRMESKIVKYLSTLFAVAIITVLPGFVSAQETETKVIDEVVAVVNEGVITLSKIKREMKNIVESEVQQGKDRAAVQKEIDAKQGELIANLINEELMIQRAKEAGLDKEADLEVNQRIAGLMKQYGLKSVESLNAEMEKSGVNPQDLRESWRKQAIRDLLIQREVHSKVYWEATAKEVKDYFEKNKSKFTKPETVTLSEIFLSFAGRDEKAVREKAKQMVAQLRGGADFEKLAVENSDKPDAAATKGKVDTFEVSQLSEKFSTAIKGLKKGDVTDPIDLDEVGINILRVDERSAASAESFFDERNVRTAILSEKLPSRQKNFMAKLRQESYIKINDAYRPLVAPILFEEERKEKTANK